MAPTRISPARTASRRDRAAGIGRPGGMLTLAVTAAVVFVAGRQFLAPTRPEIVTLTPVPLTEPPPPATPPPPPATTDAAAAVAAAESDASASAASTTAIEKPAEEPTSPKADKTTDDKAADDIAQADKDRAREAWRKNKPDLHTANGKTSILIPLKGSSADASHKYLKKTHTLVITLPQAASLNTLHFNKLHRDGFSVLWVDQAEANPRAADGTKLRLVFNQHAVPDIEIRDEFVRVTIARQVAPKPEPVEKPEPREAAPTEEKDKSKEKDAE
jgi:hypothetical protein